ncbi:Gastricsin [Durusdinium trenchii]|uniref:Gastricsin n=1 Tax=Durusdinium trenchii TaxID=1381693 RepID=A0ABP0NJD7_9DINO
MLRSFIITLAFVLAFAEELPEDVCGPADGEECALSLRQLRGREAEADVALHQGAPLAESPQVDELAEPIEVTPATAPETAETTTPAEAAVAAAGEEVDSTGEDDEGEEPVPKVNETKMQDEREAEEGGTCCFSGENMKDMCGTCYPMSIASYKSKCSKKNNCAGCGGTWCASKCVIGAADPYRKCQTAYPTGTSKDPVCSRDAAGCKTCGGDWCRAGYNSHFTMEENQHGREVPAYMSHEETEGICCYRGSAKNDTCGTCADIAKDTTCSVKSRCSGCGGTWCPSAGPKCVKAFKNKEDPCNSAFPLTGIAQSWDFCSLNEKHCTSCKGAWCAIGNITYYDGQKYDPNKAYVPATDQRLTPVNETEVKEAEEEVAKDDTLDDLFPDGLA